MFAELACARFLAFFFFVLGIALMVASDLSALQPEFVSSLVALLWTTTG